MDCFVAALLAMMRESDTTHHARDELRSSVTSYKRLMRARTQALTCPRRGAVERPFSAERTVAFSDL
jgi:hypothetical protein